MSDADYEKVVLRTVVEVHPSNILNANDRKHWGATTGPKQVLRAEGLSAGSRLRRPMLEHVRMDVWATYPDRKPRDVLNLYPTMKSFGDGLVDAGVIEDDNDLYLSGPFMRWGGRLSSKPGYFEFLVKLTATVRPPFHTEALAPSLREKLGI